MPTVDDLTISLTIKNNSNLDKLRKNLDAILKTTGTGIGGAGKGGRDLSDQMKKIKSAISRMDEQMNFLLPTISPPAGSKLAQQEYARRVSSNIEAFKENIAEFLSPEKIDSLRNLAKDLNITELTTENMQEGIEKLLDKYNMITQSIAKGELIMTGEKAKKFLESIDDVIKKIMSKGSNLTKLRKIEKNIPESLTQIVFEKMMDKLKIKKKGQFTMTKIGYEGKKGAEKVTEWIKDVPKAVTDNLKTMFKDKSAYSGLMYALKDLGYKPEQLGKLFDDFDNIKDDEGIQNLIKGVLKLKEAGDIDFLALPKTFKDIVEFFTKVNIRAPGGKSETLLDINVLGGDVAKLKEIIPNISDSTLTLAKETGILAIELKTFLDAGASGNLEFQKKIYGPENLLVVASMISKSMRESLEEWGVAHVTVPYLQDMLVDTGITTALQTSEELKESIGDLVSKVDMERIEKMLESIVEKSKGDLTLDQIKTILGPVSDMWDLLQSKEPLPET